MYTALPPLFGPIVGVTGADTLATPFAVSSAYSPSRSSTAKAMCAVPGLALPLSIAVGVDVAVLEQLEEHVGPGDPQDHRVEIDGRVADQLADVRRRGFQAKASSKPRTSR